MSNINANRFVIGWENLDTSPDYDYNDIKQTVLDHDGLITLTLQFESEDFNGIKTYRIFALNNASIDIITEYGDNILTDRMFIYKNNSLIHYVDMSPSYLYDLKNISVLAGDEIKLRIQSPSGLDIYQWDFWSDSRSRANLIEIDESYSVNGDREIYSPLIYQETYNFLPFSLKIESAVSLDGDLPFSLNATNDFNLKKWIDDLSNPKEFSFETHNNHFYVDILSRDKSGIKMDNVRFEDKIYGYNNLDNIFYTPRFSWGIESSEDVSEYNTFWGGNSNNLLVKFKYYEDKLEKDIEIELDSEPYSILRTNKSFYITNYDTLNIFKRGAQLEKDKVLLNNDNDVFAIEHDGFIWTTQSYYGKIIKRNISDLSIAEEYSGFDAPKKIIYSIFHKCFFVMGTNILWKFDNGQKQAVYEIKDYYIKDFDISTDGKICILFHGLNNQYIRVINPDLYSFSLNEELKEFSASFCKYCDGGIFYILVEKNNSEINYNISHYIFNLNSNNLKTIDEELEKTITTTTTTKGEIEGKISIIYPSENSEIIKGQSVEVLWASSESITDLVSISLFKGGSFLQTIELKVFNNGVYSWMVPIDLEDGIDYQIEVKWLSLSDADDNKDVSSYFSILSESIAETILPISSQATGIDYNSYKNQIAIMLRNGLFGYFDLNDMLFYGLFDTGFSSFNCFSLSNLYRSSATNIKKIRVFVGSQPCLNNKWDSGEVDNNNYIYYGGGKNLKNGEIYYWNIQFYEENKGWSDVQTKQFTMPKKGV
jgi:hypothetical protein